MIFVGRAGLSALLQRVHFGAGACLIACLCGAFDAYSATPIPEHPLITTQSAVPLNMMVVARDHTLFYEAYNDASDINGDGVLDVRFKPSITYYGLFDSTLCYTHSGKATTSDLFTPAATAGSLGTCSGSGQWSGNWLNYATTSRIDALRKVFYGGYRDVDTATQTILRRAYIPQDAHSWAKEYTSVAVDGYNISDYTPLSAPCVTQTKYKTVCTWVKKNYWCNWNCEYVEKCETVPDGETCDSDSTGSRHHFFGNLTDTRSTNCTNTDCVGRPPLLRVVQNSDRRVWNWASTERPVLMQDNYSDASGSSLKDYAVRVEVCTETYSNGCKRYPNGNLKPIGLLQEYGEGDSMLFGLLTGSYNKNKSGGVLRKVISSFKGEVDSSTGVFTSNATIVKALNSLRIIGFEKNNSDNYYEGGWVATRPMNEGEFVDWGNPIGEMMYETLRYFAAPTSSVGPTSAFATSEGVDKIIGLPTPSWDDPYDTKNSAAKAQWCARPSMLVVSGINPSFDSDQVPGCYSEFGSFSGDISNLDASALAKTITDEEGTAITGVNHYIGQSGTEYDGAPTPKTVTSLGNIRGLAPEEPTKQGSYYSASVAYYGKSVDLRPSLKGKQSVDEYSVVLSSPLPQIKVNISSKTITLVPFAKSVGGGSYGISSTKGNFQPTDQIVDFYVDTIANSSGSSGADYNSSINGGRYYAKFRINFEDVEQGADHDMDAITVYEISELSTGKLQVKLTPEYQAGDIRQNMGYVISGTTQDGVYLTVQDENVDAAYYLNVPDDSGTTTYRPGSCDVKSPPTACKKLPYVGSGNSSVRTFTPGTSTATLLKDPLWYASKWGGFVDLDGDNKPDQSIEWDADNNGVPDTYFLVQNPLKLSESLKKSFDTIIERSASAGNITSNGQEIKTDSKVFQSQFNSARWDGELFAYPITSSGVGTTPSWKASEKLPLVAARNLYTWKDTTTKGVAFSWSSLSTAQQTALKNVNVLNYLRGDQSKEVQNAGTYRTRKRLLGDIVHSSPYYVKDTDTVYAGANDGMLHAFNATTGVEQFGYFPSLVFSKLLGLSSPSYTHTFFVDGDVAVSARTLTTDKNILVASTGRGAKGLFALDVTAPASFDASKVKWEYDGSTDPDFGYVLGRPQLALLEQYAAPVVIVGNGHNSTNGSAVLYIMNLDTGAVVAKLDTGVTGDNGMSAPALWDDDGDGRIDSIYAGDLKGNVWRFEVASASPSGWGSKFVSGTTPLPLFTTTDGATTPKPQPITAQLTVVKDTDTSDTLNVGKKFVFFGTGSYVYGTDPDNKQVQTWYGLIDDDARITSKSSLKERTIKSVGTLSGYPVRVFSAATAGDMSGMKGWYIDLTTSLGERIVTRSNLYNLIVPTLIVSSIIPNTDACEAGGGGYINAISPFTGARLAYSIFDFNDDSKFDDSDKLNGEVVGSFDPNKSSSTTTFGMPGEATIVGDRLIVGGSSGEIESMRVNLGNRQVGRLSWREIMGD